MQKGTLKTKLMIRNIKKLRVKKDSDIGGRVTLVGKAKEMNRMFMLKKDRQSK